MLGALSVGAVLLALATYAFALDEMNEVFDEQLRQVALTALSHVDGSVQALGSSPASVDDLRGYEFLTQVWTLDGTRLSGSASPATIPFMTEEGFKTISTADAEWRVYTDRSANHLVQAVQSITLRHELAADVALKILIPSVLAVPLLALLLAYALGRGMHPLTRTADDIRRRSATSLAPIDVPSLPLELQPLVVSINDLLARLAAAMVTQRQLTADAAHELRTPLTALRLQVQTLASASDEASRQAAASDTQQGLRRATRLVEQLLSLSRVEPDGSAASFEAVDLEALAKSVVTDFSALAEAKSIDLGAVVAPSAAGAFEIVGNREQLQVMLNNLVDNALRYMPNGGRIDVSVHEEPRGDGISIAVADSGPGLPPDERERVFDRFYRGSTARQRDVAIEGSGLGLAIVKGASARHGARIDVFDGLASESAGPGLTVRVTFPRPALPLETP
ncbi:MAG: ATP-binding protein [Pseudomonadota bacterium]|nr:ATP-binding protein [Pseudomonadota bacterium]